MSKLVTQIESRAKSIEVYHASKNSLQPHVVKVTNIEDDNARNSENGQNKDFRGLSKLLSDYIWDTSNTL
ncbi:hypothetical protein U1Q18_027251 [Sarracenia purpurea var. burkii]